MAFHSSPNLNESPSGLPARTPRSLRAEIISWYLEHQEIVMICLIFLITLILVSPTLMPQIVWINPDDEAKYIDSGWRMLRGDLRSLSWGPIVSMVYALLYLFVSHSANWFLLEDWIGRFVFFSLLWWSSYTLARQFKEAIHPYLIPGLLLVSGFLFNITNNQSDAVFASLSMLGLANILKYSTTHRIKNLWLASVFVSLGVFARVESVTLVGLFIVLAFVLGRHHQAFWKLLIAVILPPLVVLVLYSSASYATSGQLNLGVSAKSYDSFTENSGFSPQQFAQEFGTQEQNHDSVLRAIAHNPVAFLAILWRHVKIEPAYYLDFYNKKVGFLLALFSLWGMYTLVKKKATRLLVLPILWGLPSLIALPFLPIHIIPDTAFLILMFGAAGIQLCIDPQEDRWGWRGLLLSFAVFTILGGLFGKGAILVGGLVVTFILMLIGLTRVAGNPFSAANLRTLSLSLLLSGGIILHGSYPFPNYPQLGVSPEEQAIHYLESSLPNGATILCPTDRPAIAAKMNPLLLSGITVQFSTSEHLWEWLKNQGIQAVLIDFHGPANTQNLSPLLGSGLGSYFTLGFNSPGNIQIYLLTK